MTTILKAELQGMLDPFGRRYVNTPTILAYVDQLPSGFLWETDGKGHYYATNGEGWVKFLFHSGDPERQQGFGGSHFNLEMKDGSVKTLIGPWSSRAGAMNRVFPHCVETICKGPTDKYGGTAGFALELAKAAEVCKMIRPVDGEGATLFGVALAQVRGEGDDDIRYDPVIVKTRELRGRILTLL